MRWFVAVEYYVGLGNSIVLRCLRVIEGWMFCFYNRNDKDMVVCYVCF